jgi:hypothetical protein
MDWSHAGAMAGLLRVGIVAIQTALPDHPSGSFSGPAVALSPMSASAQTGPALTLQPHGAPALAVHSGRQVQRDPDAPTRFIIDMQPASYEATQIRF